MSVPHLKRIALFLQKLLGGSQNFEILSRDLGHAHLGSFCGPDAVGSVLYVCAKSEVDGSIRSKVIRRVPKFRHLVT